MILVLFLCAIITLLILCIVCIIFSTIKIKLRKFEVSNIQKVNNNYKLYISTYLFKIKWISIKLDKNKIAKISKKMHFEKLDIKKIEKDIQITDIKEIINIKPKISYLNLNLNLGIEDVFLTSYIVPLICTAFTIVLPYVTIEKRRKNIHYKVTPIYNNKNVYHIKLDSVIEVRVMTILKAIYNIYKARKSEYEKNLKSKYA